MPNTTQKEKFSSITVSPEFKSARSMTLKIYVNSIRFNRSLVDGPGVRTVIFFQGCDIHCKGCQNPSSWDILKGKPYETDELVKLLREKVINKKITLSGGEPLMQKDAVLDIIKKLPDFDIALYTGHELNEVPNEILQNVNYVKTGPFVEKLKSSVTPFVGSTNQTFMKVNHAKM